MSRLRSGRDQRTVDGARFASPLPPGAGISRIPAAGAGHPLTPGELHERRVEWGKLWGARISEATKQWKGEL